MIDPDEDEDLHSVEAAVLPLVREAARQYFAEEDIMRRVFPSRRLAAGEQLEKDLDHVTEDTA